MALIGGTPVCRQWVVATGALPVSREGGSAHRPVRGPAGTFHTPPTEAVSPCQAPQRKGGADAFVCA